MQAQKKQKVRHNILWLGLIFACIGLICGLYYLTMPKKVAYESLEYENIPFSYIETTSLNPTKLILVKPQVSAKIEKYLVTPGTNVKKGQVLAQLDVEDIKRQMEQIDKGIISHEKIIKTEKKYNVINKGLFEAGIITKKEYDALNNKNAKQDDLSENEDRNALKESMEINYKKLDEILKNPVIVANADGELATYYNSEDKIALEDRPFAMIQQITPLVATSMIPTKVDLQKLQAFIDDDGREEGKIVGLQLVNVDNDWQTIVTLSFANQDYKLKPGKTYKIHFEAPQNYRVLSVNTNAVHEYEDDNYVYVLNEDNIIDVQSVEIGESRNGRTLIVDGLNEGDKVVTTKGEFSLGEKVRV